MAPNRVADEYLYSLNFLLCIIEVFFSRQICD